MDIGKRLKAIRLSKNMSLRELGKAAHVSHSFIADIEAGRSRPSVDTLAALAKALNVTIAELTGDDEPNEAMKEGPPSDLDLEKILLESNVMFDGEPLDEEDKQDIIEFLKVAWKTIRKKKGRGV
ncbi:helix-turn-helix domain-containing protein [Carboxydocella sp. ULO1]|uniref:helix-turn-helix domain-containing protein n=1 Tax=Carboxydocella sp. ULO1 TaxID=1926599 RepID=UPI0009AD211F|nr:helix-turn-helix transcriptional regulator [Carboxydocella sp. ULO1]GAW28552.1 helix-turn-helix domain-containing protein [Carboxydocella sp. ULO1]